VSLVRHEQTCALFVKERYLNPPLHLATTMDKLWGSGYRQHVCFLYHATPYLITAMCRVSDKGISIQALSMSTTTELREGLRRITFEGDGWAEEWGDLEEALGGAILDSLGRKLSD
jgi:hypothetical protein